MIKYTALLALITCLVTLHTAASALSTGGVTSITHAPLSPATTNIPQPVPPKEMLSTTKPPPTRPPRPDEVISRTPSKLRSLSSHSDIQLPTLPKSLSRFPFKRHKTHQLLLLTRLRSHMTTAGFSWLRSVSSPPDSTKLIIVSHFPPRQVRITSPLTSSDCGDPKVHAMPATTLSACNAGGINTSYQPLQLNVTHKSPWGLIPAATAVPIKLNVTHESPWGLSTASHVLVKMSTASVDATSQWHPLWAIGTMLFLPAWPLIGHKRWRAAH